MTLRAPGSHQQARPEPWPTLLPGLQPTTDPRQQIPRTSLLNPNECRHRGLVLLGRATFWRVQKTQLHACRRHRAGSSHVQFVVSSERPARQPVSPINGEAVTEDKVNNDVFPLNEDPTLSPESIGGEECDVDGPRRRGARTVDDRVKVIRPGPRCVHEPAASVPYGRMLAGADLVVQVQYIQVLLGSQVESAQNPAWGRVAPDGWQAWSGGTKSPLAR